MIQKAKHPGLYVLPNGLTTLNLFAGFFAILQAMAGNIEIAVFAVLIAMLMDGLDGKVARLTHSESNFGEEYDSLSDMVSFGLAPAVIIYTWAFTNLGKLGWLASFIFVAGAALRLARFGSQSENCNTKYFNGLPSPAAAVLIVSFVYFFHDMPASETISFMAVAITILAGILMVTNIQYLSFKDLQISHILAASLIVILLFVIPLVLGNAIEFIFLLFAIYTFSGPITASTKFLRRQKQ